MKFFHYILLLSFFILSCGTESETSKENTPAKNNETAINDASKTDSSAAEKAPKVEDFETFWTGFLAEASNKEYLVKRIHFPFMDDVFDKTGISQSRFESSEYSTSFFEDLASRHNSNRLESKVFTDEDYMNRDLEEFLLKQFDNFDDMYILKGEADPSGVVAYVRLIDDQYKFVGYESTQTAE